MPGASRSIDIDASPEAVYALITEFERYPEFVPNQTRAEVVSREGDLWQVRFELSVVKRLMYTLALQGVPARSLRWSLVEGDMMQSMGGGWTLEPLDDGARTHATYDIDVELKGFVPRSVSNALIERTLPDNLEAFKREAERRRA